RAQRSVRTGSVWKGHENILESAMNGSERWRILKNAGVDEEAIRKSFGQTAPMRVFAWNSEREVDTVMTPLECIKHAPEMIQTAFMVMDPLTGHVKAWVGGIDFRIFKYDHVNLQTKRQVGSSIKPFLYALAVEEYGFTPETECEAEAQYFPGSGWVLARN